MDDNSGIVQQGDDLCFVWDAIDISFLVWVWKSCVDEYSKTVLKKEAILVHEI